MNTDRKNATSVFIGLSSMAILLLGMVGAVLQVSAGGVHWLHAMQVQTRFWVSAISVATDAVLLWSSVAAVIAVAQGRNGKRDAAVAVTRAGRLSFYAAAISTFATLPMWRSSFALWLTAVIAVNALPLLGLFCVSKSPAIRRQFGSEFPHRIGESAMKMVSRDSAILVVLMLVSLLAVLTIFSIPAIKTFGWRFVVGREWRANPLPGPVLRDATGQIVYDDDGNQVTQEIPPIFGALPVIWGTTISSIIALVFAVPLSLGASLFLVRIAVRWLVVPISLLIEFLAAIPSIAYGIWGLFVMCPFLQRIEPILNHLFAGTIGLHWLASPTGGITGRDMLAGGLILGVMVVPIITAISRDVLRSVPRAQLEGTAALGATWWESSKEMLKYSRAGLFGAVMLGLARAAGETMAITMVIGNNNQIKTSLFAPAQTMSSLLANEFADPSSDLQRSALTEVALILLVMSLVFNVVARYFVVGKQTRSAATA